MKKLLILTTMFIALSAVSFGQMATGPHDFGGTGFAAGPAATEICFICHSAHNNVNAATEVLWNQTITVQAFTMYSNAATITGTIDAAPGASSKLCLSCHDGTTAMGTGGNITFEGYAASVDLGLDLSSSHPISITYDEALDLGLNAPASLTNARLFSGTVECASCHDAHERSTALLRVANTSSALCLECHNK
jgi:predicted CXXCH cytochrome family protein